MDTEGELDEVLETWVDPDAETDGDSRDAVGDVDG